MLEGSTLDKVQICNNVHKHVHDATKLFQTRCISHLYTLFHHILVEIHSPWRFNALLEGHSFVLDSGEDLLVQCAVSRQDARDIFWQ